MRTRNLMRLLFGLALLAALSLVGQLAATAASLSIPGPIVGLAAYLIWLLVAPSTIRWSLPAAHLLTRFLGALIVPAAVGLAAFAPLLDRSAGALALVLVASTLITGAATAALYSLFARRRSA